MFFSNKIQKEKERPVKVSYYFDVLENFKLTQAEGKHQRKTYACACGKSMNVYRFCPSGILTVKEKSEDTSTRNNSHK